jgi:hypothetical protein
MTPDELQFLEKAGALDPRPYERTLREKHDEKASIRPVLPVKTMIIIAILTIIAAIGLSSTLDGLAPYATISQNKDLMSYLEMSSSNGTSADISSEADTANQVYGMRTGIVTGIIILGVIIEAIMITTWFIRCKLWEDHHGQSIIEE